MSQGALFRRVADVAWIDVDDEVVLWKDTVLHRLNAAAARVWNALAEPCPPDALVAAAAAGADVDAPGLRAGVGDLLQRLQSAGLVEAAPAGSRHDQ